MSRRLKLMSAGPHGLILLIIYASASNAASDLEKSSDLERFEQCRQDVVNIALGNEVRGVNNQTLSRFIFQDHIPHFDNSIPRGIRGTDYITLTYEGCRAICGDGISWNPLEAGLSTTTNWIFPLSILLSLPYQSFHERKVQRTLAAVSYWLGSPQTALTATIWGLLQTRNAYRRARTADAYDKSWEDAMFVLCCFNQFDLLPPGTTPESYKKLLSTLIYGLFLPIAQSPTGNGIPLQPLPVQDGELKVAMTRELLGMLAFELRMLRRRAVIPALASLGTFLLAFIFAVVLAFSDLKDSTTVFTLNIGLMYSWLPPLVTFCVVDRNPVSAIRVGELMSRWLFNVDAVRAAASTGNGLQPVWWKPNLPKTSNPFKIGDFIGQCRRLGFCGLSESVLTQVAKSSQFQDWDSETTPEEFAEGIAAEKHPPLSWRMTTITGLAIVWIELLMAFWVDHVTPPSGLGCWSLFVLIYAILSSVSWVVQQASRRPPLWAVYLSHGFNTLAILWLIFVTATVLTGGLNNCYCRSTMPGLAKSGGWMDFESLQFYKDHFKGLTSSWAAAATIGGLIPIVSFIIATRWWQKCKPLWAASQQGGARPWRASQLTSTVWLGC